MKKIIYTLFFAFSFFYCLQAETAVGEWKLYPSYYNTGSVVDAKNVVFALANGSLYSHNKEDNSVETYSKLTGLSDKEISNIAYNPQTNSLIIIYSNGNIDVYATDGVHNIPYLKDKTEVTNKTINSIYFKDKYAYLAGAFGIMLVDMNRYVTKDTYQFQSKLNISTVCIKNDEIYAAAFNADSILTSTLNKNLLDLNNWKKHPLNTTAFTASEVKKIFLFDGKLVYLISKKGLYYENADKTVTLFLSANLTDGYVNGDKLTVYNSGTIYNFQNTTATAKTINYSDINGVSSYNNKDFWVANGVNGFLKLTEQGDPSTPIFIDGPKRNLTYSISSNNDRLLVVGGGRWANRYNNPGTFMIMNPDGKWINYDEEAIRKETAVKCADFLSVAVDPRDSEHYFVSSWGEGVYEFKGTELIKRYDYSNSNLESSTTNPNTKINYVRVDGLCFDKDNNLWMTNSESESGIKIYTANGEWKALNYNELADQYTIGRMLITSKGQKWVIIPRGTSSVFAFDNKGDFDNISNHDYLYFTKFYDQDNKLVDVTNYYCAAEDKNGAVWIGTTRGPIIFNNPTRSIKEKSNKCARVKIPYEEGGTEAYYLLENDKVTAIAVDGGNRKWLGTETSGIWLVSESGTDIIENFTEENSPLLSNNITSISINDKNGEVFIGTDRGLASFKGIATEGSEDYSNVYAYPNPVREDYTGTIVVTGLKENSFVKITDLNGSLIYQGKSLGGQIGWDGNNSNGERVKSGIYLVLAVDENNKKESVATKIMIIK